MIHKVSSGTKLNNIITSGKSVDFDSTRDNSAMPLTVDNDSVEATDVVASKTDYQELLDNQRDTLSELQVSGQMRFGTVLDSETRKKTIITINDLPLLDEIARKYIIELTGKLNDLEKNPISQINADWDETDENSKAFILNKPNVVTTVNDKVPNLTVTNLNVESGLTLNKKKIFIADSFDLTKNGSALPTVDWIRGYFDNKSIGEGLVKGAYVGKDIETGEAVEKSDDGFLILDLDKYGYLKTSDGKINGDMIENAPWMKFLSGDKNLYYIENNQSTDITIPSNIQYKNQLKRIYFTNGLPNWNNNSLKWPYDQAGSESPSRNGFFDNDSYVYFDDIGDPHYLASGHVDLVNGVYPVNKEITIYAENIGIRDYGALEDLSVADHIKKIYTTLEKPADNLSSEKLDNDFSASVISGNIDFTGNDKSVSLTYSSVTTKPVSESDKGEYLSYNKSQYGDRWYEVNDGSRALPVASNTTAGVLTADDYAKLMAKPDKSEVVSAEGDGNISGNLNVSGSITANNGLFVTTPTPARLSRAAASGALTFKNGTLELTGDFNISGNIIHNGSNYEVDTEKLNIKDNFITLRSTTGDNGEQENPDVALGANEKSGMIVNKYNGVDDLGVVVGRIKDEAGNLTNHSELVIGKYNISKTEKPDGSFEYIVEEDNLQPLLTRSPREEMQSGKFIKWNSDKKRSETSDVLVSDIIVGSDYIPTTDINLTTKQYVDTEISALNIVESIDLGEDGTSLIVTEKQNGESSTKNLSFGLATTEKSGLMSAADKSKLDSMTDSGDTVDLKFYKKNTLGGETQIPIINGSVTFEKDNYILSDNTTEIGSGYNGLLRYSEANKCLYLYIDGRPRKILLEDDFYYGEDEDIPNPLKENVTYMTYGNSVTADTEPEQPPNDELAAFFNSLDTYDNMFAYVVNSNSTSMNETVGDFSILDSATVEKLKSRYQIVKESATGTPEFLTETNSENETVPVELDVKRVAEILSSADGVSTDQNRITAAALFYDQKKTITVDGNNVTFDRVDFKLSPYSTVRDTMMFLIDSEQGNDPGYKIKPIIVRMNTSALYAEFTKLIQNATEATTN